MMRLCKSSELNIPKVCDELRLTEEKLLELAFSSQSGLRKGDPLTLDHIIEECFKNPGRKKYPLLPKEWGLGDLELVLEPEFQNPEYYISLLDP